MRKKKRESRRARRVVILWYHRKPSFFCSFTKVKFRERKGCAFLIARSLTIVCNTFVNFIQRGWHKRGKEVGEGGGWGGGGEWEKKSRLDSGKEGGKGRGERRERGKEARGKENRAGEGEGKEGKGWKEEREEKEKGEEGEREEGKEEERGWPTFSSPWGAISSCANASASAICPFRINSISFCCCKWKYSCGFVSNIFMYVSKYTITTRHTFHNISPPTHHHTPPTSPTHPPPTHHELRAPWYTTHYIHSSIYLWV